MPDVFMEGTSSVLPPKHNTPASYHGDRSGGLEVPEKLSRLERCGPKLGPSSFMLLGCTSEFTPECPGISDICDTYLDELKQLSALAHPYHRGADGKALPLLAGLSLYLEMGSDIGPLTATYGCGRLAGVSLHEGELLGLEGLAKCYGFTTKQLLGNYQGSKHIDRDVQPVIDDPYGDAKEVCQRLKKGYTRLLGTRPGPLAVEVGNRDWVHHARAHEWDNFIFVPSASGDEVAVNSILSLSRQQSFNSVWLKGSLSYRFQGCYETAEQWWRTVDEKYLRPGAVVLISEMDRPLEEYFKQAQYVQFEVPVAPDYPTSPDVILSVDKLSAWGQQHRLVETQVLVRFHPVGNFHVWVKPPALPTF